jgi:glycosidase
MYHVVQRSFYDSNGDTQGDLAGLTQKLDYLQELGITSILLLPLYESVYYHNYFSGDFEKIDEEFGSKQDFFDLVSEAHKKGIKIYMDMETQYVTEDHIWYKDSYKNPASAYSDYIVYNDSANEKPESIIFGITELYGYNGAAKKVATVKLHSKKVQEYNYQLFKYWMDPNNDGKFEDGVDGFRLDHMMDNLDWKNRFTNLFTDFWAPLIDKLKQVNPNITIIAEQAEWGNLGAGYFTKGKVDRVFAFKLQQAIVSFDKKKIELMADSTFAGMPAGKQQITFIENHDMQRFASAVKSDAGKQKIGAVLNILSGGIPSIYYGQELGMTGSGGFNKFGKTDANDIPQREAFEWYTADTGRGMAIWYKNTGPWWDQTNLKANDGISLEEQKSDPTSLWNFYRDIIKVRRGNAPLITGSYQAIPNDNDKVLSFLRYEQDKGVLVVTNLSDTLQTVTISLEGSKVRPKDLEVLFGKAEINYQADKITTVMPSYGVAIYKLL